MSAVPPSHRPTRLQRRVLAHALWIACAGACLPAFAAGECGAPAGGQVVCTPTTDPVPQVRYEGVSDLEVILKQGVVIDGRLLPEPDTAVVVYGDGAISLHAEDGTVIHSDAWPAVDVVSNSGPVDVRVDQVFGGSLGVAALANGDVNVYANHVEGAIAIQAQSLGGNVSVDVASVLSGAYGAGVFAQTTAGDISILAGEAISEGNFGTGLWASTENGSVSIEAGFIRAEGLGATAIFAESWEGGDVFVDVGTAVAIGESGYGIIAGAGLGDVHVRADWVGADGAYGVGVGVFAFNGDAFVDIWGVSTSGDSTRGIDIQALGTVALRNDSVSTSGNGADAINIENVGEVAVESRQVTTFGNDAYGMRVLNGGNVTLDVEQIMTYGERSAALFAYTDTGDIFARLARVDAWATTGDWFAVGLSSNSGDVALQIDEYVRANSGYAITLASMTGGAHVVVAEGAEVFGQAIAIDAATGAGTRIDIAGTVESGTGPVINVAGNDWGDGAADIRVAATGEVRGRVQLSGGDDVFANAGAFVSSGTSVFGAGEDRFANTGEVTLQDGATSMSLEGLEHFDNAGRVSLVNGRTGDVFAVDGTLDGRQGNALAVDLDLVNRTSDRIEVGALSGTNALEIDLVGRGALLGMSGIRVLSSEGAQTGNELVLADGSRNLGFVGFRLDYDGLDSWTLESDLTDAAYLAAAVPAGVRDVWRQGVQSVSTHLTATHDETDANGVWFQAIGGDFEGTSNLSHALGSRELQWQGDHEGLQVGAEMTIGHWRAGITGGYGKATMDLGGLEETQLDSLNAGLYARYANDGWFANAVLRGDRVDVESKWNSIGLNAKGDGSAIGVEFEGGHRFALSRLWIEPNVRLAWIDVSLPDQEGASGNVHWDDSAVSTGELGLRLGTDGWNGVRPYASMSIAREFGGEDATFYDLGFDQVRVTDEGDRSFSRFAGGVEWTIGRVDLYGEIETRVGDMEGTGGRLGARIRF
jgi:hypothetical protein